MRTCDIFAASSLGLGLTLMLFGALAFLSGTYSDIHTIPNLNTATFTATQIVAVTNSLTIRGGYTTTDWNRPDPDAHPTILDAGGRGRVLVITGAHVGVAGENTCYVVLGLNSAGQASGNSNRTGRFWFMLTPGTP